MRVSCVLPCQAAMLGVSSTKILTMKSFTTISLLSSRTFMPHRIRQQSPNFCSGGTGTCLPCFAFKQLIHRTYSSVFDHVNVSEYCPQVIEKMSVAITLRRGRDGLAIDNSSTVWRCPVFLVVYYYCPTYGNLELSSINEWCLARPLSFATMILQVTTLQQSRSSTVRSFLDTRMIFALVKTWSEC